MQERERRSPCHTAAFVRPGHQTGDGLLGQRSGYGRLVLLCRNADRFGRIVRKREGYQFHYSQLLASPSYKLGYVVNVVRLSTIHYKGIPLTSRPIL